MEFREVDWNPVREVRSGGARNVTPKAVQSPERRRSGSGSGRKVSPTPERRNRNGSRRRVSPTPERKSGNGSGRTVSEEVVVPLTSTTVDKGGIGKSGAKGKGKVGRRTRKRKVSDGSRAYRP